MDESDNAQIVVIADDVCRKAGIATTWINSNRFGIHAYKHIDKFSQDTKSQFAPCEAKVHFLRPDIILFSPLLRKLVNESNGIFLSVQNLKTFSSGDIRPELLKHSKQYRSILRACVENLQEILPKESLSEEKTMLENFLTIFYQVECIWHLTEILYVDTVPGDVVLPQLLEWISFHFPSKELIASKILSKKAIGADLENSNYWEAVMGCALHGKLNLVCRLLTLHSKADHSAFITADNIIRTMPVYNVYGGYSVNEFIIRWKHWQMDLCSNLETNNFVIDSNLETLMKLIAGDESVLWEYSMYTETWYELLAAKLFYSAPCCKQLELSRYANNVAERWQAHRHLDRIILALIENDLYQVIKEIQYMSDNGWFAAHLIDLLYKCGKLNILSKEKTNVTAQLHESLILEYGTMLMSHHSLWQCGASYLIHCPKQGLGRLEILLQSLPTGTEARINKIINIARDNNMPHVVASICKIQGMKSIRQGRLGNALTWALKAHDGNFTTYIADQFLKHYAEHGELECRDLLENLGSCMLASDRLTFLGKYCEFHHMYGMGEFREAASLLVSLLVSNLTPKYFWSILLTDAIPLLEAEDVIFSSNDCYELLRCVEAHGDDPKFQDKISIFRIGVARNLARSLSLEGCQTSCNMFSITLVNIDSYQASPIPELDVTFSEFRGSEIKKIPIIRIFGSTVTGKKTCLHIHGAFPYMYVSCPSQENTNSYVYQLAASIDSALNTSFGSTLSTNQHVYKIQRVSGIPFYGYHEKEHLFLKIYFYNPAIIKRTADLLQNGAILNQTLQPYEAHIPYILQFMIDYNLYGMNLINLNNIKYRCSLQGCTTEDSQNKSSMDLINSQMYLPTSVIRQSICELEVDAHASDILNRQNVTEKLELNPGLAAIWEEEKARRTAAGLENAKSQLLYPKTSSKVILPPTSNDIYQKNQLLKRLNAISQTNETIISNTIVSSYPIEVEDNENVLNASCIINHNESFPCEENIERTLSDNFKFLQVASSAFLEANRSQSNVTDTSILDADDIQLVEMLADLAEENEIKTNIDDDSVLGSQYSNEPARNDPEEEIEDLNITSLDLDDLSSWESMHKLSNHGNVREITNDKQNMESMDDLNVNEESDINVTLTNFPQLDGIHDLYGNMLDYERETVNDLSNIRMIFKNDTAAYTTDQCLSENNKYVAAIVNTRKDYAMCNSYKNLYLVNIIEYIANNPNRYYLKKKLYNFLNRYYFHIFMKTSKNLQNSQIDSTVVRKMYYLENIKRRIVHNKKMKKELCVNRYHQLQTDHRDLDVYDIVEIETFEYLEHINQYYITDYKKDKYNYKQDSKSCVQQNIFLNINHRPSNFPMKFIISSVDGATVTDSSDSESEVDITIDGQEKRVCVYKSGKTNARQNMIQITPKKRKLDFKQDDYESPSKRRNMAVRTPKRKYNSPNKVPRSPQLSGNYSPLDITITSPKTSRSPVRQRESPKNKQYVSISDTPTTSTTPKRKTRSLRVSLLCEKRLTNLSNLDLENNVDDDNIQEKLVVNETDMAENIDYTNTVKVTKTTTVNESIKEYEKKMKNPFVKKRKEIRKRLSFLYHNEIENTLVESDHHTSQSENLIAIEHPIDQTCSDAIATSSNNENSDNSVPNSQQTEKSSTDMSPERNYASGIRNLAKELITFHDIIPETDPDEDESEVCNTTFTQHVNEKLDNDSQCFSLERNIHRSRGNALITITTKYQPPSTERILESMTLYGIPKCRSQKPFFSNKHDYAKYKDSSNTNTLRFDIPIFKSSLEEITSIKLWRRMKVNEFHPSGASIKSYHIKRSLAGYNLLTIKPLMTPPSSKDIKNWIRAKRYLSEKNCDIKSLCKQNKKKELNVYNIQHLPINIVNEKDESQQRTSNNSINNNSNIEESNSLMLQQSMLRATSDNTRKFGFTQNSDNLQISRDNLNPSLKEALENPLLYNQNKMQQQLGVSYGQIECISKESYSNASSENLQNARAITAHQYLTLLSLEVHTVTREDLLPDPQYDSIAALFYAIYNDVPMDTNEQIEHGAIIVNPNSISTRLNKIHSASVMCPILYVMTEQDMFNSLIKLIEQYNPDILLGWEVEMLSWGYIFQRALHLNINNFPIRISKVPYIQIFSKSDNHMSEKDDIKVLGRNILDVWRIMRHEAALLTYTFENVMHHVLHERIPCPSFKILSTWWKHESMIIKSRVIHHYVIRVVGTLKLLNHLDIIGRTCEHARLFGIQFYEVFSRGSQFRVESMMLRLAKPMNYIAISPSIHQRAKMRAPESLPLIMEPESEFYTDPLIVLDFQSLYPSMIIAYNYCFSTCLGRIEHIGQYGPFEFGAATLRIRKNAALKLQDKINFSPCGVAFVKKEVRQGILPRMLEEILNTRLMVKESMKLHSAENRTLQRVLHSQQLGLKLIANVTYGYTSANFSGRMPCIEIGDSVVSKGRETLERAIKLVESTPKWGARVVYGDTDSLFVLLAGKSREEAFTIGEEIADAVTAINPPPVKLKFEKVLYPSILQTKKRYCGYMYETRDQEKPEFLAKGIETVRRDGCPAVSKILEKALKILFDTKDISLVKQYVIRQFDKIFQRRVSIQDLTFAKEFRGMHGYKASACVPALELTRRLIKKDPRAVPRISERVRYVIVAGAPNQPLIHCVRTPMEIITDPALIPNSVYYITKVIIPPLNRCFNLFGIDLNIWYKEISHRTSFSNIIHLGEDNSKSTIRQFFNSITCIICGEQTNKEVCPECLSQPSRTILVLLQKIRQLERNQQQIAAVCHSCIGRLGDIDCSSLDCPILYRMVQARKELTQVSYINNIIYGNNSNGIKGLNAVAEWY